MSAKTDNREWELLGEVGVDTGMVWIGDPCYVIGEDASHGFATWADFCAEHKRNRLQPAGQHNGLAIPSGWGDGVYPVFVKRLSGRVSEVKVVFLTEADLEDDEVPA